MRSHARATRERRCECEGHSRFFPRFASLATIGELAQKLHSIVYYLFLADLIPPLAGDADGDPAPPCKKEIN